MDADQTALSARASLFFRIAKFLCKLKSTARPASIVPVFCRFADVRGHELVHRMLVALSKQT
jgi:hypothetical protein